jgi:hypothetical protein
MKTILFSMIALMLGIGAANAQWIKNFGGSYDDEYASVTAVSDGVIAVGNSERLSFGTGDWTGVEGRGSNDAIVVKYNSAGDIVWKKNFGGGKEDYFFGVTAVSDGIVAVGVSYSFGNGDWTGVTGHLDSSGKDSGDAAIVKFDDNGNVVWKKNFGGGGNDEYLSVTAVSDGIIAVGHSAYGSFGNGDWTGVSPVPGQNAIIVKYDNSGNVIWKNRFAPNDDYDDSFFSVTAVSDGIIAAGEKYGFYPPFKEDALLVKFDNAGNLVWDKKLGGSGNESFAGIATVSDGVIAVGDTDSFGAGVWTGIEGKGKYDAIVVKYDNNGNVLWKKNLGGSNGDYYKSVSVVSDGFIVCGNAYVNNTGDWTGMAGKKNTDAIVVKYDLNGNVQWKKNLGGQGYDYYYSVVGVEDGIIAAGNSHGLLGSGSSFGNGDLANLTGNGEGDAIIVKYTDAVSSIETINAGNAKVIGYYSIMGQKLDREPETGIYIIQYDNGKAEKVFKMK